MYYSQFLEDEWIDKNIELPEKGIYIDVGAGHPLIDNNTFFLQEKGWQGLCIDADPRTFLELFEKRDQCFFGAVAGYSGFVPFYLHPTYSTLSSLTPIGTAKRILTACFTLHSIVQNVFDKIDFLSIDIEGHEIEALSETHFLTLYRPKIVVIEYNTNGVKDLDKTTAFLESHGYETVHITEANVIGRLK